MEVTDDDYFEKNETLRYFVRLLIRHPNIDPEIITRTLQLAPDRSVMVGTPRKDPKGNPLPGLHSDSGWSYRSRVERNRFLFKSVVSLIDKLEPHKTFFVELNESGGRTSVVFDLPGDTSIGDVLPWREMARLGAMRIDLSVEVFPDFN